jgi:hypothetical protein
MTVKIAWLLVGIVAASSHEDAEGLENDSMSLLQTSLEESKATHRNSPELEPPEEYGLQKSSCENEHNAVVEPVAFESRLSMSNPSTEAHSAESHIASKSDDPAGASALRMALQFMTLLIVLDGFRRWRLQKKPPSSVRGSVASNTKRSPKKSEAWESDWINAVKAARSGDFHGFKHALAEPSYLTHTDAWGCTPLHFAAEGGSAQMCEAISAELLKQGSHVDAIDAFDETSLHFAAREGHASVCKVLINAKAQVNAINKDGLTPLVIAGRAKQAEVCRVLADHGGGVAGLTDEELPPFVVSQIVQQVFAT